MIVQSIEYVIVINKTNVSRIELCENLEVGGYTPNIDIIKKTTKISKIPIMVIVRNHQIHSYYSEQIELIIEQIKQINETKAHGMVFSATLNNKVDRNALKLVKKELKNKEITFRKTFDHIEDKTFESLYLKE